MYYLVDFAFENISDRALERIRKRSILQGANKEQVGYTNNLDFSPKLSKKKLKNMTITTGEDSVDTLRKQLSSLAESPSNRRVNNVIKTRQIGTKTNPLTGNIFPNTKTTVKPTIKNVTSKAVKNTKILSSKLFPYVAAPTALIGGMVGINKLRGKTWNGKEKYE